MITHYKRSYGVCASIALRYSETCLKDHLNTSPSLDIINILYLMVSSIYYTISSKLNVLAPFSWENYNNLPKI